MDNDSIKSGFKPSPELQKLVNESIPDMKTLVVPRGTVLMFAGDTEPESYMFCDGRELSRSEYLNFFQFLGIKFGAGDGETTFNIPTLPDPAPGIKYIIKVGTPPPAPGQ